MITIATMFWDANENSQSFSLCYDESWVDKLYRGFKRNLTQPFRFICWVDRERTFEETAIEQRLLVSPRPLDYGACLEPYAMNEPMIIVGLDTLVTGNCDHLADYCFTHQRLAVPRDPIFTETVCNGVALVPAGWSHIWRERQPRINDMERIREMFSRGEIDTLDTLFPGQVKSYRCEVKEKNRDCLDNTPGELGDARLVYFHGRDKMHEMEDDPLIWTHWI